MKFLFPYQRRMLADLSERLATLHAITYPDTPMKMPYAVTPSRNPSTLNRKRHTAARKSVAIALAILATSGLAWLLL
jgi:hypothetical protein